MGMLGGLLHAVATVTFGVDHIISGVAINIIALGAVQYLASLTFVGLPGGGQTQSPKIADVPTITIAPLSDALRRHRGEGHVLRLRAGRGRSGRWSPTCRRSSSSRSLLLVVTWFVLWRTSFGLRLRSCGESPAAAESLGRQRATLQVRRGADLRRPRRPGGWLPGDGRVEQLPRRPDRRSRLHRPGRDDLRQLAPGRPARRRRPVRLHRDARPARGRRRRCTRCCSRSRSLALAVAVWQARQRQQRAAVDRRRGRGRRSASLYFSTDEVPERLHHA